MRTLVLKIFHRLLRFSLNGDLEVPLPDCRVRVSCVINFFGRIDLLEGVLYSLVEQDLSQQLFEVVLVEDRGGTVQGKITADKFSKLLPITYAALDANYGNLGYARNYSLLLSKGEYILFLDDDTVLLQKDFLSVIIDEFTNTGTDVVIPHGNASYCLLENRYCYHEPYFATNRCTAYRRNVLQDLRGFVSAMTGQEDVEFVTRCIAAEKIFYRSNKLNYLHPPLIIANLSKPAAVGASFTELRRRYPFIVWLLMLINGCRYLPLYFLPLTQKWKMQGKFSLGFLLGIYYSLIGKPTGYSDNHENKKSTKDTIS